MARSHRTASTATTGPDAALAATRSAAGRKAAATLARNPGHMSRISRIRHESAAREKLRQAMPFPADPSTAPDLSEQARRIIRLLMLCRSDDERFIVAFHHYHGLAISQAAQQAGLTLARAADMLESLQQRVSEAEQRNRLEMILAKGAMPS